MNYLLLVAPIVGLPGVLYMQHSAKDDGRTAERSDANEGVIKDVQKTNDALIALQRDRDARTKLLNKYSRPE